MKKNAAPTPSSALKLQKTAGSGINAKRRSTAASGAPSASGSQISPTSNEKLPAPPPREGDLTGESRSGTRDGDGGNPHLVRKAPLPASDHPQTPNKRRAANISSRATPQQQQHQKPNLVKRTPSQTSRSNAATPAGGGSLSQQVLKLNPPNPVPKAVQEAVQYVETVGSAIVHRALAAPPPTSMLEMKDPQALPATPSTARSGVGISHFNTTAPDGGITGPLTDRGGKPKSMNSTSLSADGGAGGGRNAEVGSSSSTVAIPLSLQGLVGGTNSSSPSAGGSGSGSPSAKSSPRVGVLPLATLGLLRQLHLNANKLIEWFHKIENGASMKGERVGNGSNAGSGGFSGGTSSQFVVGNTVATAMEEAERYIQLHSSEVISTCVGLGKQLKTWPEKPVMSYMALKSTNLVFEDCKRAVTALHAGATIIATVRRVVRERDLARARALTSDYVFAPPLPPSSQSSERGGGGSSPLPIKRNPRTSSSRASRSRGGPGGGQNFGGSFGAGHFPPPTVGSTTVGGNISPSLDWLNGTLGNSANPLPPPGGGHTPTHVAGGNGNPYKPMAPPLVTWLHRTWVPAMEQWTSILAMTTLASESDAVEVMKDALTSARTDVVARSSMLQEILLPGETLTDLVEKYIEEPLEKLMVDTTKRKEVVAALSTAVRTGDMSTLGSRIRAAEGVELRFESEKKLVTEGQQLLIDLQRIAKVTVTLSIAQRSSDLMTLVRALNAANSLILSMGLAPDKVQCQAAVKEGAKILSQPITNTDLILGSVQPDVLIVAHLPSQAWASELSDLYAVVAERLAQLFEQHAVRKTMAQQLPGIRGAAAAANKNRGGPALGPPEESVAKATQRAKQLLDRCKAAGIGGPELDELRSIVASSTEIQVKIHFDSSVRLIAIPEQSCRHSFSTVLDYVKKACKTPGTGSHHDHHYGSELLRIRYQDDDGDYILVDSQADWELLLRNFTHRHGSASSFAAAKVEIYVDVPTPKPASRGSSGGGIGGRLHSRGQQQTPEKRRATPTKPPPVVVPTVKGRAVGGAPTNTGKRPSAVRGTSSTPVALVPQQRLRQPEPEEGCASWVPMLKSPPSEKEEQHSGVVSPHSSNGEISKKMIARVAGGGAAAVKAHKSISSTNRNTNSKPGAGAPTVRSVSSSKDNHNSASKNTAATGVGVAKHPQQSALQQPPLHPEQRQVGPNSSSPVGQWEVPENLDIHTIMSEETTADELRQRENLQSQLANLKRKQNGAGGVGGIMKESSTAVPPGNGKKATYSATQNYNDRAMAGGRPQLKPSVRKGPAAGAAGGPKPLYGSAAVGSNLELIGRGAKH